MEIARSDANMTSVVVHGTQSSRQSCWNTAKTVPDRFDAAERRSFRARALRNADGRSCMQLPSHLLQPARRESLGTVAKIVKELRERTKSGGRVQGKCPASCWHGCVNLTESLKERLRILRAVSLPLDGRPGCSLQGMARSTKARRHGAAVTPLGHLRKRRQMGTPMSLSK